MNQTTHRKLKALLTMTMCLIMAVTFTVPAFAATTTGGAVTGTTTGTTAGAPDVNTGGNEGDIDQPSGETGVDGDNLTGGGSGGGSLGNSGAAGWHNNGVLGDSAQGYRMYLVDSAGKMYPGTQVYLVY